MNDFFILFMLLVVCGGFLGEVMFLLVLLWGVEVFFGWVGLSIDVS